MKVIVHDLAENYSLTFAEKCDAIIQADGKYAFCQGCFKCWTKHPAECFMKDKLQKASQIMGRADELIIITENLFGCYSAEIKTILDRTIGSSTPFFTYRNWETHHILRYGKANLMKVLVYGDITDKEKESFNYLVKRNALNSGHQNTEVLFFDSIEKLEKAI